MEKGMVLLCNGEKKTIAAFKAQWSLNLRSFPHKLYILWEGETTCCKYESDNTGEFAELETL